MVITSDGLSAELLFYLPVGNPESQHSTVRWKGGMRNVTDFNFIPEDKAPAGLFYCFSLLASDNGAGWFIHLHHIPSLMHENWTLKWCWCSCGVVCVVPSAQAAAVKFIISSLWANTHTYFLLSFSCLLTIDRPVKKNKRLMTMMRAITEDDDQNNCLFSVLCLATVRYTAY